MIGIAIEDTLVCGLSRLEISLLLMNMANLEENVCLVQWRRRVVRYPTEAFQALVIFVLLFVDDSETKVNFVSLVKVWCHAHHLGEGFFSVLQTAVSIIQNTDAIPKLRFLGMMSVCMLPVTNVRDSPLDHGGCKGRTGRRNKLFAARPSLDNSGLGMVNTKRSYFNDNR